MCQQPYSFPETTVRDAVDNASGVDLAVLIILDKPWHNLDVALAIPLTKAARDYGLVGPITQPAKLSWSFSLFNWDLVDWSVLPGLLPNWLGMVFVVAFSSSLDVAAIEIGEQVKHAYPTLCATDRSKPC